MKSLFLLFSLFGMTCATFAQVNTDSLWRAWNDAGQADTNRLMAIQALAWDMLFSNPDSTRALAQQELQFAEKKGLKKWQAKAWNVIGSTQNLQGDYATAMASYQKALAAMQAAGDKRGVAAICNNIGLVYRNMGDNLKALEYYQKDLQMQEELADRGGIANAYNNLGTLYSDQSNFAKALEYYQKSARQQEALDEKRGMAIAYNNIGTIYQELKQFTEAQDYFRKSLDLRFALNDRQGAAAVYGNMGMLAQDQQQYTEALGYFQKSMTIQEELGETPGLFNSIYNLGMLYQAKKDYPQAMQWCKKALALSRQMNALRPQRNACHCLYEVYKSMGQPGPALHYHERYLALNDSLQKETTGRQLTQMEFARQIMADSLGREEEKLKMEMAYQADARRKNRIMNALGIVALVVLALALGFWSRMLYFRKYSQMFQNKAEHLEKQQLINEIALLKTQVNPHFLFNSLSILSSLVRINPDLSEQFIDQLSRSYRYILEQQEQSLVALRTELEFIQSYAFLLKIRFENKFDLRFDLPETALDQYRIAPLTLQLLIENAVKHNRMSLREPLIVEVSLGQPQTLIVKNQLQLRSTPAASTGIGLQNIINRYALLTDRPVWAGECEDAFVVKIPLINNQTAVPAL